MRHAALIFYASVAVMLSVIVLQYGYGVKPCDLCMWQRLPYLAGGVLAFAIAIGNPRLWKTGFALLVLNFAYSTGLAIYHSGIELGMWNAECESIAYLMAAPTVPCDEVSVRIFGLSLANWNIVVSYMMTVYCFKTWRTV